MPEVSKFKLKETLTAQPSMNPYLEDFWQTDGRNYVLHGGRASSKSWDAAAFAIFLAINYKVRFLCTRQFQNKLSESVYTLLKGQAERFGVAHLFKFTKEGITCPRTGSEFLFYGLARNLDEIKSLENVDILWIEEAQNLTEEQWKVLEPTIRKEGSKVWIIFNPQYATDFVYRRFVLNPPPDTVIRQINYVDNPFLSNTMLKVIEAAKLEDGFDNVYLGVPMADEERVLIKRSWLEACVDAHITLGFAPRGKKVVGFDVADDGADLNANVSRHGSVVTSAIAWKGLEHELMATSKRTHLLARELGAEIVYDCVGIGAHCGSKFKELNDDFVKENGRLTNRVKFTPFNAGGGVPDPDEPYIEDEDVVITRGDYFSNAKAVAWWDFANRVRNTYEAITLGTNYDEDQMISFSSDIDELDVLFFELSSPKRDFDKNGRVKVESKEDLAKRDIKSPNLADACVMAFWEGEVEAVGFFG